MPSFTVLHPDGGPAKRTKVSVSFDGGGMVDGITDDHGRISLTGSGTSGKIFVQGREVYRGSLGISQVRL